ncbi:MAG: YetF domain-containing protein [Pyrinomonadaceae bacterium]
MDKLFQIDWHATFVPTVSLLEIILRGTLIYLVLFAMLRILRREAGGLGIADVLVIVLIADASQNAMASEYKSVTEGVVLVGTIVFWDYTLDFLAYHFPRFQRLVHPGPLLLIKNGRMVRENMRREMISREELLSQLREEGVESATEVKKAYLEGDGRVSVIKKKIGSSGQAPKKNA